MSLHEEVGYLCLFLLSFGWKNCFCFKAVFFFLIFDYGEGTLSMY